MGRRATVILFALAALTYVLPGATLLRIVNPHGAVEVRVEAISQLRLTKQGHRRPVAPEDVAIDATPNEVSINVQPPDGQPIDILAEVPYGTNLELETEAGPIALTGLVEFALLQTVSGEVRLRAPWRQTPLDYRSEAKLGATAIPPGLGFSVKAKAVRFRGPRGNRKVLGGIQVRTREAGGLIIEDMEMPADSRVHLMEEAATLADEIVAAPFRSNLKTVQVFIAGPDGLPVGGIEAGDFEVMSSGRELTVESVQSPDEPLNVVVLVDRSGSMRANEETVADSVVSILQQAAAARRLGGAARDGAGSPSCSATVEPGPSANCRRNRPNSRYRWAEPDDGGSDLVKLDGIASTDRG